MDRACDACGVGFQARSVKARFCSDKCRSRARYRREVLKVPESPKAKPAPKRTRKPKAADSPTGTLGAVVAELTEAGRLQTSAGQAAIALASRIDAGAESSAGLAALTRELSARMAEATANVAQAGDALDELRAKREARRAG
jgi:ABC-type transporter Mla subunit MlaD